MLGSRAFLLRNKQLSVQPGLGDLWVVVSLMGVFEEGSKPFEPHRGVSGTVFESNSLGEYVNSQTGAAREADGTVV